MQKCPKMSIVVTPAVGSLLTEPPGNQFMPQLAVPSFIVPGYVLSSDDSIRNIYSRHGFAQLQVLLRPRPDERVVEPLSGGHRGRIEVARKLEKNQNRMRG